MIIKTIRGIRGRKSRRHSVLLKLFEYVCNSEKTASPIDGKICLSKQYLSGYDIESWVEQILKVDDNKSYNNHIRRVVLRHEVCSFARESTNYLLKNRDALKAIQKEYMRQRSSAPGVAITHYEEGKSIHCHYVFGSTTVDGTSNRLNNKQFKAFKLQMEYFELTQYPELHRHSGIEHGKGKKKVSTALTLKYR